MTLVWGLKSSVDEVGIAVPDGPSENVGLELLHSSSRWSTGSVGEQRTD
jgi:hypothetical protein